MKRVLVKFIIVLFVCSLLFHFVPLFAQASGWISAAPTFSIEIITALTALTGGLFYYLWRVQQTNPSKFIQSYLLSITVKMLVGCALILVIILNDSDGAVANAALFIVGYFTLTGIEIYFLWSGKKTS